MFVFEKFNSAMWQIETAHHSPAVGVIVFRTATGSSPSKQRGQTTTIEMKFDGKHMELQVRVISKKGFIHSPIWFVLDLVQIFPALLAEIFVRTRCLVHNTNTTTMLPDFA